MTDIVLAILASNALFAFIQFLIQRHDQRKQSPERMMLKALGEDRLAVLLKDWLHADVRTATEWKTITALYKGYKALGGNDGIDKLYAEAKEIPTTE